MMLFVGCLGMWWLRMGSRKSDLPPNFDFLDAESQDIIMEQCCRLAGKASHGHAADSPLLKSREKIK